MTGKKKKRDNLFSGDKSREMWAEIGCITDSAAHNALYTMGCKLQLLEHEIEKMKDAK